MVAWAAVHQAARLTPLDGLDEATARLLDQLDDWRDPSTGLLSMPLPWSGFSALDGRSFAFGVLPVGDAFVIAARTQRVETAADFVQPSTPRIIWWPWFVAATLPIAAGVALLFSEHRRYRGALVGPR